VKIDFPKAELHLHLEGTIEPETLRELARRNDLPAAALSDDDIRARYQYSDFLGFLEAFKWVTLHLKTPEDYGLVANRALEKLHAQHVRYAEIYFSAGICLRKKIEVEPILEALEEARWKAEAAWGIRGRWILDAVRQFGPEEAERVARIAARHRDHGVVGIGLGGDELAIPAAAFRPVYEMARAEGLRLCVHAGETGGPASIWAALKELGAERIGHGIAALEDPALVDYLRERQTPLEVCVTSNYATGVVAPDAEHPVRRMFEAGLRVVISSDDPAMFGSWLQDEYRRLAERHGFSEAELRQMAGDSFQASFLPEPEKAQWAADAAPCLL
jgi:adenosine deaminase/aminodeoxyfutalosine deaminase